MTDLPAIKYLDMAAKAANCADWDDAKNDASGIAIDSIIAHARTLEALAKYEPEPVDEDEAALVRILDAARGCSWAGPSQNPKDAKQWNAALAQYKAERPTITDDEALLIAREICASFADYLGQAEMCRAIREGHHSNSTAFQFALAMVKRDPAALEAFRGVGRG